MTKKKLVLIAFTFAFFQALMPMIGWVCVHTIINYFKALEKLIPYIALALLSYIGISMFLEKEEEDEHEACTILSFKKLIIQGIATSIDALATGLIFVNQQGIILWAALIIGLGSFIFTFLGCIIGLKVGQKLNFNFELLGGIILIMLGVKIFIEHYI